MMIKTILSLLTLTLLLLPSQAQSSLNRTNDRMKIVKSNTYIQKPTKTNQIKNLDQQKITALDRKREKLLANILNYIRTATDPDQKSELEFRLASLYIEDYHSELQKAQIRYDLQFQQKQNNNKHSTPQLDRSQALVSLNKATEIFERVIKRKNHSRRDEALYFLGSSYIDNSNQPRANIHFRDLIKNHPDSKYLNEALLELADDSFLKNAWKNSAKYYSDIIRNRDTRFMNYATYKLGWCYYNMNEPKETLFLFKKIISENMGGSEGSYLKIKREAIKDIALPFTALGHVEHAMDFYNRLKPTDKKIGLETMASIYTENNEIEKAISLWSQLKRLYPNTTETPQYDLKAIHAYYKSKNETQAENLLYSSYPNYDPDSHWYKKQIKKNKKEVQKVLSEYDETAYKISQEYHSFSQKTKQTKDYQKTRRGYVRYINTFNRGKYRGDSLFYIGEIEHKFEKYLNASQSYYRAFKETNPNHKLHQTALKYSLASITEYLTKTKDKSQALEGERIYVKVSKVFLHHFPNAKNTPEIHFQLAEIHYKHKNIDAADKNYQHIVRAYPQSKLIYPSAERLLSIYNKKKDYLTLYHTSQQLLRLPHFKKQKFRARLSDIARTSQFKHIETLESKGLYEKSARSYLSFHQKQKAFDSNLSEKALYNASVNFVKAKQAQNALKAQELFINEYPKSPQLNEMILLVAKHYESVLDYNKASRFFHLYANKYPKNPQAPQALRLAALYYWGDQQVNKGAQLMRLFQEKYGNHPDRLAVRGDLETLYQVESKKQSLVNLYQNNLRLSRIPLTDKIKAYFHIAEVLNEQNSQQKSHETLKRVAQLGLKNKEALKDSESAYYVGEALIKTTLPLERRFQNIRLTEETLQQNLQTKLDLLKKLESKWTTAAEVGTPDIALKAISKTAAAYWHLAEAVSQSPTPSSLSAKEKKQYKKEVKKTIVDPLIEKATTYTQKCLNDSQSPEWLSQSGIACLKLAQSINPKKYNLKEILYVIPPVITDHYLNNKKAPKEELVFNSPYRSRILYTQKNIGNLGSSEAVRGLASISSQSSPIKIKSLNYAPLSKKRSQEVMRAYKKIKGKKNKNFIYYLTMMRSHNPDLAIKEIRTLLLKYPNNPDLLHQFALSHLEKNHLSTSYVTWLSLRSQGVKSPAIENGIALIHLLKGENRKAELYYRRALEIDQSNAVANINLALFALSYGQGKAAYQFIKKADRVPQELKLIKELIISQAFLSMGKNKSAYERNAKLYKKHPKDPWLLVSLGTTSYRAKKMNPNPVEMRKKYTKMYLNK